MTKRLKKDFSASQKFRARIDLLTMNVRPDPGEKRVRAPDAPRRDPIDFGLAVVHHGQGTSGIAL